MTEKEENMTIERASLEPGEDHVASVEKAAAQGRNVDDALRFTLEHEGVTWTAAEERKVRWKIDMTILPLLFLSATIAQGDSQAYGFAAIFGLITDLKLYVIKLANGAVDLDLHKYSFTSGMANLGAVAGPYPLLFLAQYLPYGKFNSAVVIYSGLLAILTITCKDFSDIMALRFFYGFNTVLQPVSIIISAMWWKTNEQPLRMGIYITGAALGNLIGEGIDFGAVKLGGAFAAEQWKWIYVVLGSVTIAWGLLAFFTFPASPMTAWFLNEREKVIAVRRVVANNTGIQTRKFKLRQLREAFLDPQLYLLCIFSFAFTFVNNALGSFGGLLVTSFGYTKSQALLVAMPASAVAAVAMALSGWLGTHFYRNRILLCMLWTLPSIIGMALLWKSPRDNIHALLAGLYLSSSFYGALVQVYALLAANLAGHTKKTAINAMVVILSNLGGFSGPWAYIGSQAAEGYPTGQISALSLLCASEAAFAALWAYYAYRNRKKAAYRAEHEALVDDPNVALADMTDRENPIFLYSY